MANTTIVFKEKEKRRRWPRVVIWLAVCLVFFVVAAYFVVTNPAFIRNVLLPRVGDALHANITVSGMSFSPFKQIVLHDLTVQAKGQAPVFTASEVNVRYDLWDILRGNIHVDEIALNSPMVELIENPDGSNNLEPLLQALQRKSTGSEKPKPATSTKPPQIDLGKLALRNASLVEIRNYGDGRSNVLALTNLDFTLSNVKNGQSAALQLSAGLWVDENPPGGTNGFLAAGINGSFNFDLTPDLKPASASGKADLAISSAGDAFGDFSAFGATLNYDATPTEIKQLDLHFEKANAPLGQLAVSGPLDLEKMEGRLNVDLLGIDKRVLNLAGAAHGIDFGTTAINSTNEITLANSGTVITATGQFNADKVQLTRAGQTTPTLDFSARYDVTVDQTKQNALLHELSLTGAQNGQPLLDAHLTQPMNVAWGAGTGGMGNAALDLVVTNLHLADWRPFLGNTVSAGDVNVQMKLSSEQAGKQLGFDVYSQIADLTARLGSNQTFQATIDLQAQGQVSDFKQFNLSEYRLQVIRQNQSLITVSGSATYNLPTAAADAQVALETSLPGLADALPQPDAKISSGTIKLKGQVTQKNNTQTVAGQITLADFTGRYGKNSFQHFGSTMDVDISRTPEQIQIKKLDGNLTQDGNAGGIFALTGSFESSNKAAQLNANLS
ncbi:MAG TPA: AsmA family protein, partial [Candidatus Saccharimonadales bacterium]|nr:AsmA family protein [Candidatus Saccharimonadales bacterium]